MARSLTIEFDAEQAEHLMLVNRVRNFGEVIYRELRVTGWGEIDIHEVDRAVDRLVILHIPNPKLRRLKAWIEKEMARHHLAGIVDVA